MCAGSCWCRFRHRLFLLVWLGYSLPACRKYTRTLRYVVSRRVALSKLSLLECIGAQHSTPGMGERARSGTRGEGALRYYDDMDHWCHTDVTRRLYPEVTAYRWHRCKSWSGTTFHDRISRREGVSWERWNARDRLLRRSMSSSITLSGILERRGAAIGRTRARARVRTRA